MNEQERLEIIQEIEKVIFEEMPSLKDIKRFAKIRHKITKEEYFIMTESPSKVESDKDIFTIYNPINFNTAHLPRNFIKDYYEVIDVEININHILLFFHFNHIHINLMNGGQFMRKEYDQYRNEFINKTIGIGWNLYLPLRRQSHQTLKEILEIINKYKF